MKYVYYVVSTAKSRRTLVYVRCPLGPVFPMLRSSFNAAGRCCCCFSSAFIKLAHLIIIINAFTLRIRTDTIESNLNPCMHLTS